MNNSIIRSRPKAVTILLGAAAVVTVVSLVFYPSEAFKASLSGLELWWNTVFPALLPFYILCDIAAAYGLTRLVGRRIGAAAGRLFGFPATGGTAWSTGWIIGSPSGALVTAKLRKEGRISRSDAERLSMSSHFANPILMVTIVAAAFLQKPELGLFIVFTHYSSMFVSGMILRITMKKPQASRSLPAPLEPPAARRSFGQVLGESVADSLQKLMELGGSIIVFSVALRLTGELGLNRLFHEFTLAGFLEMHLGAFMLSQSPLPPQWIAALICGVLGWGGLATHLQVRAAFHETDIRYRPFAAARFLHAAASVAIAYLLWSPYARLFPIAEPSFSSAADAHGELLAFSLWPKPFTPMEMLAGVSLLLILMLAFSRLVRRDP